MNKQPIKAVFISFLILLGGCSNFSGMSMTGMDSEVPADVVDITSETDDALVVENLVREAADLGHIDIVNVEAETSEDQIRIEPEVPTVPMTANRVVELAINDYLQNRQSLLRRWIERSHTYFPMIEETFKEVGVPDELKYLALGESSLQPVAKSPVGATGMWQFMAATGRGAGLTIDAWVDERRDPEKATRAAAEHMLALYESYGNNWHLALAGYNCSYRCITRAVRQAGGTIENPPSYWEIYPYLPRETRDFVPRYIAASLLVSNPEKYGISAESFGEPLAYDVVEVKGMLSLEDAADMAGITLANLKLLNPELIRTTLPDRVEPYPLKLPEGTYDRFVAAFSQLPVHETAAHGEYIVKSGDTLGKIAMQFDTTVAEVQAANSINDHLIRINQKLFIPGTGRATTITLASTAPQTVDYGSASFRPIKLSEEFQLVELEGSTPKAPMYAVSLSVEPDEEFVVVPTIYQIRRGDTLSQIADQFNITVRDIQDWNSLNSSTLIRAGQSLTLHAGANTGTTEQQVAARTYEVKSGDSLHTIAQRFGVSVANLKQWNDLTNDLIFPGQNLQLN